MGIEEGNRDDPKTMPFFQPRMCPDRTAQAVTSKINILAQVFQIRLPLKVGGASIRLKAHGTEKRHPGLRLAGPPRCTELGNHGYRLAGMDRNNPQIRHERLVLESRP